MSIFFAILARSSTQLYTVVIATRGKSWSLRHNNRAIASSISDPISESKIKYLSVIKNMEVFVRRKRKKGIII